MKTGGLDNGGARRNYIHRRDSHYGNRRTNSRRGGFFSRQRDHFRRRNRGGRRGRTTRGRGRTSRRGGRTQRRGYYGREDRQRRHAYNPRSYSDRYGRYGRGRR